MKTLRNIRGAARFLVWQVITLCINERNMEDVEEFIHLSGDIPQRKIGCHSFRKPSNAGHAKYSILNKNVNRLTTTTFLANTSRRIDLKADTTVDRMHIEEGQECYSVADKWVYLQLRRNEN